MSAKFQGVRIAALFLMIFALLFNVNGFAQDEEMTEEEMQKQMMEAMQQQMAMQMVEVGSGAYTNSELGYEVDVPEGWSGMLMQGMLVVYKGGPPAGEDADTNPPMMFIVSTKPVGEDDRFKDIETCDLDKIKAEVEGEAPEGDKQKVIEITREKLAGNTCVRTLMEHTAGEMHSKAVSFTFRKGDLVLSLLYNAKADEWDSLAPFVEKHKDSFKFK